MRFHDSQTSAESPHHQLAALWDCFALGRRDARFLVLVRHLLGMLSGEPLRTAIHILAHATPHGDITRHGGNWIPPDVETEIRSHFRWSVDDLVRLLNAVARQEWDRGCLGQDLHMLLIADPTIKPQIEAVAVEYARRNLPEVAETAR